MIKELNFVKENDNWYIDLPNWMGPKSALLMVGGASDILEEFGNKIQSNRVELSVSTDEGISPYVLNRQNYSILGGANYKDNRNQDVWLCPVTLFVFGKYPKTIYYTLKD